ncbi:hypothetical protein M9H77_22387 [Catharanthus roseus]|uniref:Uncharacterized protein n=1 Tax=Catharanthus roseus TaxID=4058 RepID=A0ACC0AR97_CATRO|nr:hypothetical protein M9H77_22387 [Catharanthus roseus]
MTYRGRGNGDKGSMRVGPSTSSTTLAERFSRSKELEELHKHRFGEEKGEERFYELKRKAEEEASVMDTTVPNDLRLMAIAASSMSCGRLYVAGSEAAHLIVEAIGHHLV